MLSGGLSAVQSRVNGSLGDRLSSVMVAALVSFCSGLVVVGGVVLARRASRQALRRLRGSGLRWWQCLGGLGGATFVVTSAYAAPILGVALLSVGQVAGQVAGAMAADRLGLGPSGRQALTLPRVLGGVLGVVAVAVAATGRPAGEAALLPLVLALVAGFAIAVQSAVNGRLSVALGDPFAATGLNFSVGATALAVLTGVLALAGQTDPGRWPAEPWLYIGGVVGVIFVTVNVVTVRVLGVLLLALAVVAGQLAFAVLLDVVVPEGPGLPVPVLAGVLLTLLAVAVTTVPPGALRGVRRARRHRRATLER